MTYKHGNWFCQPANEAEAREIVERAVASGADLHEDIGAIGDKRYTWSLCSAWGVYNGNTYTSDPENDTDVLNGATEYTIEQVREKFPLPGERVEQDWNGEGLPPVGVDCEMLFDGDWIQAKIICFDGNHPIVKMHIKRDKLTEIVYRACYMCTFHPLRSERERFVEYVLGLVKPGAQTNEALAEAIYDALKSGDLKAPTTGEN